MKRFSRFGWDDIPEKNFSTANFRENSKIRGGGFDDSR
jgi:hypothetical protein